MMCNKTCFFVRDGALVGDLKDAQQPMVWRMDLTRVHAAGFRVVQNGSSWELTIEGPTGPSSVIATYDTAKKANRALRRISHALRCSAAGGRRLMTRLAVVAAVVAVIYYGVPVLFGGLGSISVDRTPVAAVQQPNGQSLSADQVLRAPPANSGR